VSSSGALNLGGELKRELQLLGRRALPDGLADALVGDLGIQQDLKQLAEQHDRCVGAVGHVELALHESAAGLGVLRGDPVVEQVDDLVGHPGGSLGAERQQSRAAERALAATERGRPDLVTAALVLLERDGLVLVATGSTRAWKITAAGRLMLPPRRGPARQRRGVGDGPGAR
jgi:hypothetical protein